MMNHHPPSLWFLLFFLLVSTPFACFQRREQADYQAIQTIDSPTSQLEAICQFITDYPKSDNLLPAIRQAIMLLEADNQPDSLLQFLIDQRVIRSNPEITAYLDSQLVAQLPPDSLQRQQYRTSLDHYAREYPQPLAFALASIPHIRSCFQNDSLCRRAVRQLSDVILSSDYDDIGNFIKISRQLSAAGDSLLLPHANRFLIAAIQHCTPPTIQKHHPELNQPDSLLNQYYYSCFTELAWNAYRQRRFEYALHLISQASKFGDLAANNGYIILGAAQAECGELNPGWTHLLTGLVLNPAAEEKSPEIRKIYTRLFARIRGSREDPFRFLNQYRRSHY